MWDKTKTLELSVFVFILVFLLAGMFGLFLFTYKTQTPSPVQIEESKTEYPISEQYTPGTAQIPDSLVLIYGTQVNTTDSKGRGWPTMHIWMKKGNNNPIFIAEVGKVGEYPYGYKLSYSKKYLAVNLEKAVDIINLQTKEKKRIFTTNKWINGVTFSLDDSKLLISDGAIYDSEDSKDIHSINLASGEDTLLIADLAKAVSDPSGLEGDVLPVIWRKDGILLYYPLTYKDCGGGSRMLDLAHKTATSTYGRGFSEDGTRAFGKTIESIPNTYQDEMCGSASQAAIVSVVDPVSGKIYGQVGKRGDPLALIAFSPDNSQVLFMTTTNGEASLKDRIYKYYVQTIGDTTEPTLINDPHEILADWKANLVYSGFVKSYKLSGESVDNTLYVGNDPLFTLDRSPSIIFEYYQ